ncbi:MAG: KEOPS complex subunit Pcc1 [Halobacteriaceae archaeon]
MSDSTATVCTQVAQPESVMRAVQPDNTAEMQTRLEGDVVRMTVSRSSIGGLRSTLTDYIANLQVAATVARAARDARSDASISDHHPDDPTTDTNP